MRLNQLNEETKNYIEEELAIGFAAQSIIVNTENELNDVYADKSTVNGQRSTVKID